MVSRYQPHFAAFCQLHKDPRRDRQLAGRLKNGRRALLLGPPFHKAAHPFFESISIDTQMFTHPVGSRVPGNTLSARVYRCFA